MLLFVVGVLPNVKLLEVAATGEHVLDDGLQHLVRKVQLVVLGLAFDDVVEAEVLSPISGDPKRW